jgi:hypothetical protein
VLDILSQEFLEYAKLMETDKDDQETRQNKKMEVQTIKSKVGELNRRAYKLLLKKMFNNINLEINDEELNSLVSLRNDIIHKGTPRDGNDPHIYTGSYLFGSLIEKVFLALLGYQGDKEYYHEGITYST